MKTKILTYMFTCMDGELFAKELIFHLTIAKMQAIKFSSQTYWYMNENKETSGGLKVKEIKINFFLQPR